MGVISGLGDLSLYCLNASCIDVQSCVSNVKNVAAHYYYYTMIINMNILGLVFLGFFLILPNNYNLYATFIATRLRLRI